MGTDVLRRTSCHFSPQHAVDHVEHPVGKRRRHEGSDIQAEQGQRVVGRIGEHVVDDVLDEIRRRQAEGGHDQGHRHEDGNLDFLRLEEHGDTLDRIPLADTEGTDPVAITQQSVTFFAPRALHLRRQPRRLSLGQVADRVGCLGKLRRQ